VEKSRLFAAIDIAMMLKCFSGLREEWVQSHVLCILLTSMIKIKGYLVDRINYCHAEPFPADKAGFVSAFFYF